ncbi:hypothetical protein BCR44DRAFT_1429916, partial [Catenaria anguillulae PL171]
CPAPIPSPNQHPIPATAPPLCLASTRPCRCRRINKNANQHPIHPRSVSGSQVTTPRTTACPAPTNQLQAALLTIRRRPILVPRPRQVFLIPKDVSCPPALNLNPSRGRYSVGRWTLNVRLYPLRFDCQQRPPRRLARLSRRLPLRELITC